jgi:hypothetical protein
VRFDEMSTNLRKLDIGTARRGVGPRRAKQCQETKVAGMQRVKAVWTGLHTGPVHPLDIHRADRTCGPAGHHGAY